MLNTVKSVAMATKFLKNALTVDTQRNINKMLSYRRETALQCAL